MYTIILTIHITACVLMIVFILLQAGKGAGLSVFGGGGSDAIFAAPSGSSFMKKFTAGLAVTFGVTSLLLTLLSARLGQRSVTSQYQTQQSPAQSSGDREASETRRPPPEQTQPAPPVGKQDLPKPNKPAKNKVPAQKP
ncbi:MAG: preprotein translocase subunit SecG [Elusimicrobia bacterium]|nr:preprotein translocase subunit SecG [Elusimicrobiota bacterium]